MEKGHKVLDSGGFTQAEEGHQHPQNGKHGHTTSGFVSGPFFIQGVGGDRHSGTQVLGAMAT